MRRGLKSRRDSEERQEMIIIITNAETESTKARARLWNEGDAHEYDDEVWLTVPSARSRDVLCCKSLFKLSLKSLVTIVFISPSPFASTPCNDTLSR